MLGFHSRLPVFLPAAIAVLLGLAATGFAQSPPATPIAPVKAPGPAPPVTGAAPFRYLVDRTIVKAARIHIETDGVAHAVAMVKDDKGVPSEFVEDEVVVRNDPAEVQALVDTYHGRVVRQIIVRMIGADGKPMAPAKTTPRTVVQIDASASPLRLEDEAVAAKTTGVHSFSSQKSANLAAIMLHERAAGHGVMLNFLTHGFAYPTSSTEQADRNGVADAYQWPEFDYRAWQYVLNKGVKSHPIVAIIDGGFWLNSQGIPCGYVVDSLCGAGATAEGNSDLPTLVVQGDATGGPGPAGGPNPSTCSNSSPCPFHGNRSASVAVGKLDNHTGAAGMGGPVAVPMLIKVGAAFSDAAAAIEAAASNGASVISLSLGGSCDYWCEGNPFSGTDFAAPIFALQQGVVVVAAAGNGDSNGNGQDAGDQSVWPCTATYFCVGALNPYADGAGYFQKTNGFATQYSNYGSQVSLWAPTNIHAMPDGTPTPDGAAPGTELTVHTGTSAATPYVAGVVALMRAVNPSLDPGQILTELLATALPLQVSAYDGAQPGKAISPYDAVVMAGAAGAPAPQLVITAPADHATVGQGVYRAVTFTAKVVDPAIENWPPPYVSGYSVNPVTWKSSLDGAMGAGSVIDYIFSPTGKTGPRTITAAVTDTLGLKASTSITVDFEPNIGGPGVSIVYPRAGSTFPAGPIVVRGQGRSAVNLGYVPCDKMVWQQGIAAQPIASSVYEGVESGLCQAQIPFTPGSAQTLRLTATDVTGKSASIEEFLTITPASATPTVSIDSPTRNAAYIRFPVYRQPVNIGLHAFVPNPPAGSLTYSWSWYYVASGPASKTAIGTGQSQTLASMACGAIAIEVDVTSPSIPAAQSPTATTPVQITCSSSG